MKEIGQRLKAIRKSRQLTQIQMADILGVKQSSITKYEKGTASPTVQIFRRYADYFDVSMDYIFARTDTPQGELYESRSKHINNYENDFKEFIEQCFDPESPYYARLKQIILQVMADSKKE